MWQSRRDFQRVWEGWKAGLMAFHAFHTLSFPWSASEVRIGLEIADKAGFSGITNKAGKMTLISAECRNIGWTR
jgi:hypothetical protein